MVDEYIERYALEVGLKKIISYDGTILITEDSVWTSILEIQSILELQKVHGTGSVNYLPNLSVLAAARRRSQSSSKVIIFDGECGADINSLEEQLTERFRSVNRVKSNSTFEDTLRLMSSSTFIIINGLVDNYVIDAIFPSMKPFAIICDNINPSLLDMIEMTNFRHTVVFSHKIASTLSISARKNKDGTRSSRTPVIIPTRRSVKKVNPYEELFHIASSEEIRREMSNSMRITLDRTRSFISWVLNIKTVKPHRITNRGSGRFMIVDRIDELHVKDSFSDMLHSQLKPHCRDGEMRLVLSLEEVFTNDDGIIFHPWKGIYTDIDMENAQQFFTRENVVTSMVFCVKVFVYSEKIRLLLMEIYPKCEVVLLKIFGVESEKQFSAQRWKEFPCMYNVDHPYQTFTVDNLSSIISKSRYDAPCRIGVITNHVDLLEKLQLAISRGEPFVISKTELLINILGEEYPLYLNKPTPTRVMEILTMQAVIDACNYLCRMKIRIEDFADAIS